MTTQQDILRTMMTQLDDASDKIPEGLYLQFCDHLQNLHRMDKHQPKLVSREKLFVVQTTRTGACTAGGRIHFEVDLPEAAVSLPAGRTRHLHDTRILVLDLKFVWRGSHKTYIAAAGEDD
jgi:hypothetical protein